MVLLERLEILLFPIVARLLVSWEKSGRWRVIMRISQTLKRIEYVFLVGGRRLHSPVSSTLLMDWSPFSVLWLRRPSVPFQRSRLFIRKLLQKHSWTLLLRNKMTSCWSWREWRIMWRARSYWRMRLCCSSKMLLKNGMYVASVLFLLPCRRSGWMIVSVIH